MRKEMVGGVPGNLLGMLADLMHKLRDGSLSDEQLERFLTGQNPFDAATDLVAGWQVFYQEIFGFELDFSSLQIPARRKGFDRLIVVAGDIAPQKVYDACSKLFPCWKWTEKGLDEVIDFSSQARLAKDHPYAIWVRNQVEADEELKSLSANALAERGISGINLEERLLYELKYFRETGKHLDIRNITLCAGSRYLDGGVPRVYWSSDYGGLHVSWDYPADAAGRLRSREAVS